MKQYKPRLVDKALKQKLAVGAVLIEGAKWCGKTWTAEQQAGSVLLMNDPEKEEQNIALAKNSPSVALEGETPRLIDEWQLVPKLWDAVRFAVDQRGKGGQFILTGSAVPPDSTEIHHSGVGRIARLLMRPMTLLESQESSGEVSLAGLFESPQVIRGNSGLDLKRIAQIVCRGGWPRAVVSKKEYWSVLSQSYYDGLVESDISRVDGVKRSSQVAKAILRSYARNLGQPTPLSVIRDDIIAMDGVSTSIDSVYDYVEAFRKIYVIEDAQSWNPNLRSKAAVRTSATRYFVDPSIATQALGILPDDLINDLRTFGFMFENLCMRDLRVYMEANGGEVSHYRDSDGLECDAVVHARNGQYGLIEIKLGSDDETIEGAVATLQALGRKLDTSKMSTPAFMAVLCGNAPYAYRREDGVYVVPLGCLKP